jgi:hypothetical protein
MNSADLKDLRMKYYDLPNESARTEHLLRELRGFIDIADESKKIRFFHIKVRKA